ncbi:hypothetical protein [Clostridium guangxiense]|uniref:hypothetical protein n=1 Tax=Clostridium guangxiense TaxID=1662055 RepID=UPI0006C7171A|nr:hypothetical protein [Clostridium guangxiense]KOF57646.1 hypothetical protein AGR56_15255 [Clostridium sp. DMHC 10]
MVFTFERSITSTEINEHFKKVLSETKPFILTLQGIAKIDNTLGLYLIYIKEGNEEIKNMKILLLKWK